MAAGVESAQLPETPISPKKKRLWKFAFWAAIVIVLLAVLALFGYTVKIHWNDPNFVNFMVAWIPFVLSILLAFIPDSAMKTHWRIVWRSGVILGGLFYSALLWHQQSLIAIAAKEDQRQLLSSAVTSANQHSDEKIGEVRTDVQGVKTDVQGVQKRLETQNATISKSASTLNESIGKVGKPEPPKKAELQFSFWELELENWPKLETWATVKNNIVSVDVSARALGDVSAKNGLLALRVCERCKWAKEPNGFLPKDDDSPDDRTRKFDLMLPDVAMTKMHMEIEIPPDFTEGATFEVGGIYSCENCPPADPSKRQRLRVHVIRSTQQ